MTAGMLARHCPALPGTLLGAAPCSGTCVRTPRPVGGCVDRGSQLRKQAQRVLKGLKIDLLCEPAIPRQGLEWCPCAHVRRSGIYNSGDPEAA